MPAPAGRSVHSTGLPSAGQLAQRSRLPFIRRLNSRLTLGAGANNAVVACNQRTAIAVQDTYGATADPAGGELPSRLAASFQFSRFALISKPNPIPTGAAHRPRRRPAGSTPIGYLALMGAAGAPLLTHY